MLQFLLVLVSSVFFLPPVGRSASGLPPAPFGSRAGGDAATWLVGLRPGTTAREQQRLLQWLPLTVVGEIPQLHVLSVSVPGDTAGDVLAVLERDPSVTYAEPNARAWATESPDDPGWPQQWGPEKIGAPLAWDVTLGNPDVIIATVDSGVTLDHPDLMNQLWVNTEEVPSNGLDDDGNGQIDDVHGWHFYTQGGNHYSDSRVADEYGHGTHVAGIAAAQTNNGVGIAGMAGGSRLMTVKVLDQFGLGWYFDIARGIVYAVDNGARVINLSLGGTPPSETLQAAVNYARDRGALVVAATGNSGGRVLYPAACEQVVAVAATDRSDQHPTFSNNGPQVDLAAPGVDIYSTWYRRDGYFNQSGTSMAAPHVSGLAALIWSERPTWSPEQIGGTLMRTALDVQAPGWDPYSGWGRVDAHVAMLSLSQPLPYLSKEAQPGTGTPDSPITYTLTFGNLGQEMTGVVISDSLPSEAQFVSANPNSRYYSATHELVWGPLTLTTGVLITATVVTTVPAAVPTCTRVTNTARLFHSSLVQPLVARATHYLLPCRVYLPMFSRTE